MLETALAPVARVVLDAIGIAVVIVSQDGHLVHANLAARRALGDLMAKRTVDLDLLEVAAGTASADVTIVRLRSNGAADVVHAGSAGADSTLAAREREAIVERLEATGWKLAETARQLGISRTTLWRRLRAYGLARGDRMI